MEEVGKAIGKEEVEQFRVGEFDQAPELIQSAWKFTMINFMPLLSEWKGTSTMSKKLMKTITTNEQEALLMWMIRVYAKDRWIPEHEEDQLEEQPTKRQKRQGKSKGKEERGAFDAYVDMVETQRKEAENTGWDEALLEEVKEACKTENNPEDGADHRTNKRGRKQSAGPALKVRHRFGELEATNVTEL